MSVLAMTAEHWSQLMHREIAMPLDDVLLVGGLTCGLLIGLTAGLVFLACQLMPERDELMRLRHVIAAYEGVVSAGEMASSRMRELVRDREEL